MSMKNIIEICEDFGFKVPADQQASFLKAVNEGYKTVADYRKTTERLESEIEAQKSRAETAEETLKSFDGIDPAKLNEELENWKQKAEQAEKDAEAKIAERDFADALKAEMEGYKFTSAAAKKSVMAEVQAAGLKLKDGKILGLSDLIEQIKASDASAFVDEESAKLERNKARFTQQSSSGGQGEKLTKKDIMAITDRAERRKAIAEHMNLFEKETK